MLDWVVLSLSGDFDILNGIRSRTGSLLAPEAPDGYGEGQRQLTVAEAFLFKVDSLVGQHSAFAPGLG